MLKNMKFLTPLFCFLFATLTSICQGSLLQGCPEVQTVSNFSSNAFSGQWYRYGNINHRTQASCLAGDWDLGRETITVSGEFGPFRFRYPLELTSDRDNQAELHIRVNPLHLIPISDMHLWVMATDYSSWALLRRCIKRILIPYREEFWVITREREPSQQVLTAVDDALMEFNLNPGDLELISQSNCTM